MLFSALFGRGLLTMLAPDPQYEAWTADEGLDGETDFHIADSPFMYTRGWDFVGVSLVRSHSVMLVLDTER
jgi:hypothetical protein